MAFVKGMKRHPGAGRKKGQICKNTLAIRELLDSMGCNPIQGLANIADDPKTSRELRAKVLADLAKYVAPQLKAIEHSGPDGGPIQKRTEFVIVNSSDDTSGIS